jgi:hypothetical protein
VHGEEVAEPGEELHEARAAEEAVNPLEARRPQERRVVLHEDDRHVSERGVGDPALDRFGGRVWELPGRSHDALVSRDIDRHEAHPAGHDRLAGLTRACRGEGCERARERPAPTIGRGIRVVIAGDERDALGIDPRLVQDLGEGLELLLSPNLREVPGDDDVICFAPHGGGEGSGKLVSACARVEGAAEAQVTDAHRVVHPGPARLEIEHVHVRQVRDAHGCGLHRCSFPCDGCFARTSPAHTFSLSSPSSRARKTRSAHGGNMCVSPRAMSPILHAAARTLSRCPGRVASWKRVLGWRWRPRCSR